MHAHTHNRTVEWIDEADVADVAKLSAVELEHLKDQLDQQSKAIKARQARLQSGMERRFLDQAKADLRAKQQDTGTAHVIDDDRDVVVTIPKTVTWDQAALLAALDAMKAEDAKHYAKLTVSVDETKFKNAPPDIQNALAPARTVKPGKAKFEFKPASRNAA